MIGGKHYLPMINDHPQNFRFTKENARENAAKSWQARRERKAKLEAEAKTGRNSTPQSERLALEIERVLTMMEREKDADRLQKLSATYARLFNAWQVLTGTPNPGSRKVRGQVQQRMEPIEPINPI
jgi:uncharacterized protein YdiU (UPF0061 family)